MRNGTIAANVKYRPQEEGDERRELGEGNRRNGGCTETMAGRRERGLLLRNERRVLSLYFFFGTTVRCFVVRTCSPIADCCSQSNQVGDSDEVGNTDRHARQKDDRGTNIRCYTPIEESQTITGHKDMSAF